MKLHLCCGDVYLQDYINIDVYGDLVEVIPENFNLTTLDKYYKKEIFNFQRPIVDRIMKLPQGYVYEPYSIDEVLMISAFEHFSKEDAQELIRRIHNSLKSGGRFRFDFPDVSATVNQYWEQPEYMMRLIYGSGKNEFAYHKFGYTDKTIRDVLKIVPWTSVDIGEIVKHEYPMIGVTAIK